MLCKKYYFKKVIVGGLFVLLGAPFFLFCAPRSYSLSDCFRVPLDKKILNLMNYRDGVFVEVGANDGVTQSNTKMLEEFYGWKGILIEPSERLFPILLANRPNSRCFQCALGSFRENGTYLSGNFNGSLMGSVNAERHNKPSELIKTYTVLARSLQSILDECVVSHVNFFSLDTEGYEFNILQGINFEKTIFDYLLIEINGLQYNKIVSFLDRKGYEMVENFTNYHKATNPIWDGTHNDYLFKRKPSSLREFDTN